MVIIPPGLLKKFGIDLSFNKLKDFWNWLSGAFVALGELVKKIRDVNVWMWGVVTGSIIALKHTYDVMRVFLNTKFAEVESMGDVVNVKMQSASNVLPVIEFIQNMNVVFPIEELLAALVIILGFWAFCMIMKIASRLKDLIVMAVMAA